MMFSPFLIVAFIVVLYLISSIKILNEYERGVIFRLGKLLPQPKGPGLILVFSPIDRMVRVSLRTVVLDVPPQDIITRDNVSVKVNAVVFFRVMEPRRAIVEVENYLYATSQLAQTTLRSVLGQAELDDLLAAARAVEPGAAAHPRSPDGSVGHQGVGRRGEARGPAAGHAARDRAAGRGGTREAGEDHPRGRRADGVGEAVAGRGRHEHRAARHHAALPADADGDRRGAELHDHLPAAARSDPDGDGEGRSPGVASAEARGPTEVGPYAGLCSARLHVGASTAWRSLAATSLVLRGGLHDGAMQMTGDRQTCGRKRRTRRHIHAMVG